MNRLSCVCVMGKTGCVGRGTKEREKDLNKQALKGRDRENDKKDDVRLFFSSPCSSESIQLEERSCIKIHECMRR